MSEWFKVRGKKDMPYGSGRDDKFWVKKGFIYTVRNHPNYDHLYQVKIENHHPAGYTREEHEEEFIQIGTDNYELINTPETYFVKSPFSLKKFINEFDTLEAAEEHAKLDVGSIVYKAIPVSKSVSKQVVDIETI